MTTDTKTRPIADAARSALRDLVTRHGGEFEQLIATHLEKSGTSSAKTTDAANPTRSRKSHADVPVLDSKGRELKKDMKVQTPDGGEGVVTRFNRSQGRVVVRREDGTLRMITGTRLTVTK